MMRRIGLTLGGGGARGLCHIEFCKALDDLGVKPSIISGTSIGAIIGAFYASGMSGQAMQQLAAEIDIFDYTRMLDFSLLSRAGLVKGNHAMHFIEKHLRVTTFEALPVPLRIVATDFWRRKEVVFSSGPLIPAIRASISIPGVFEPVVHDDRVLIDGAPVNPVPMSAIRDACDILIAIDVSGTTEPPKRRAVPNIFDSVMTTFTIMENSFVQNEVQLYKPEIFIKPELLNFQILDFHRDREIMESVQKDVERFKRDLTGLLSESASKKKKRFSLFG